MSVLKIRDENGNVIEISALKGDKGADAVTDLNYNPKSANAQSGIAVAQAISELKAYIDGKLQL